MRVSFICGYYSDLAARTEPRPQSYWNARKYCWAVKTGAYKSDFTLELSARNVRITNSNFSYARQVFGQYIDSVMDDLYSGSNALLVPVPSKDMLEGATRARSTIMVQEAMERSRYKSAVSSSVRWSQALARAHEGGPRGRNALRPYLEVSPSLYGRKVILVDDLITTGGSMLATADVLQGAGVSVLGAIACGKTVYDFNTKSFGSQVFDLTEELDDYQSHAPRLSFPPLET